MAFIITVALLKGGVGKTTTAVALAEMAALAGPVTLIDADPQGSAYEWSVHAAAAGTPLRATIAPDSVGDIRQRVRQAAGMSTVIVIDAPPPGNLDRAADAIRAADVLIMPCPPGGANLDRVDATRRIAQRHDVPAYAVLSMVRAGLIDRDAALGALEAWGVPVLSTELPLTVSVQRNYGEPVTGVLARFGIDLMTELLSREGNSNGS